MNEENNNNYNNTPNYNYGKKNNGVKVLLIILIVLVLCLIALTAYKILIFDKNNDNKQNSNTNNNVVDNNSEEDNYGYALLAYLPGDGSFNEYYRIVELHKDKEDVILVSYDINKRNNTNKISSVNDMEVFKNKIYYILHYSDLSASIMCIDLSNKEGKPVELLKVEKDKYRLNDFLMTDEYIYLSSSSSFYKYNINSNELSEITDDEYTTIVVKKDAEIKVGMNVPNKLYINGKKLLLDNNELKLTYNNELLYKSSVNNNSGLNGISLFYSFDGDIIIRESLNCSKSTRCEITYYKYDFDKKEMEKFEEDEFYEKIENVQQVYNIYNITYINN